MQPVPAGRPSLVLTWEGRGRAGGRAEPDSAEGSAASGFERCLASSVLFLPVRKRRGAGKDGAPGVWSEGRTFPVVSGAGTRGEPCWVAGAPRARGEALGTSERGTGAPGGSGLATCLPWFPDLSSAVWVLGGRGQHLPRENVPGARPSAAGCCRAGCLALCGRRGKGPR